MGVAKNPSNWGIREGGSCLQMWGGWGGEGERGAVGTEDRGRWGEGGWGWRGRWGWGRRCSVRRAVMYNSDTTDTSDRYLELRAEMHSTESLRNDTHGHVNTVTSTRSGEHGQVNTVRWTRSGEHGQVNTVSHPAHTRSNTSHSP